MTWLNSGESISGLPQRYYKIIFKEINGWNSPLSKTFTSTTNKNKFEYFVKYTAGDVSAKFLNENSIIDNRIDSLKKVIYDSSNKKVTSLIYNRIRDSVFRKINTIETSRHEFEFTSRLLYLTVLLLVFISVALI